MDFSPFKATFDEAKASSDPKPAYNPLYPEGPFRPPPDFIPSHYHNFLIDIGKTYRESALRLFKANGVTHINDVFITHAHMDAIGGLDDLRDLPVTKYKDGKQFNLPTRVFMDKRTTETLQTSYFPYLFGNADATRLASNAQEVTTGLVKVSVSQSTTTLLAGEEIADTLKEWSPAFGKLFVAATINYVVEPFVPFHIKEAEIIPVPLQHGPNTICQGLSIRTPGQTKQVLYFSDYRHLSSSPPAPGVPVIQPADYDNFTFFQEPERSLALMRERPISYCILDCLGGNPYIGHPTLQEAVETVRAFRRAGLTVDEFLFTGMGHQLDYATTNAYLAAELGPNVHLCYDGLVLNLSEPSAKI